MVTASHNPPDYNGMKFVREQARPIMGTPGCSRCAPRSRRSHFLPRQLFQRVVERPLDLRAKYLEHLLSYVDRKKLTA